MLVKEAGLSAMDGQHFQHYSRAHYIPDALVVIAWAGLLMYCV